jgi:assimilatory nitrate reductase catalytic subunit
MATQTHCPYCSLQCGMRLESTGRRGSEVTVEPWPEFPTNAGGLCRKGWTAPALLRHRERLTSPLVRDRATGELTAVSWDEALDRVAAGLTRIQERHGRDSVGVFGGGGLTNEKAYALGKFARVALRTSAIDYNGRWCMSSAATAGQRAFGLDRGLPFPLADIEDAGVVVLVGSNLSETAPPAARHLDALKANGGTLVVIDPRTTATAARADVHIQPVPGTDLALANGVLHAIVSAGGVDRDYVGARTSGFDRVAELVAGYWPERVERITGVSSPEIVAVGRLLAEADSVIILTARGAEQHASGTDTVLAWINVALALGQPGRPHAGYGCITGQGNGQGGREHGQKADQLPGYRRIDDPAARAHVARVWGIDPDDLPGPGRSAYEMLDGIGTSDGVHALLVFGSNIVVSAPNASRIGERLDALDLLVVADFVMSETAARADVVLPVTQWAEETGTMTNLEGRVILRRQAVTPPDGVRSDLEIIAGLAQRLGMATGFDTDPEVVFGELGRASAGGPADYSGIDYARITRELGVFWPCPAVPESPDSPDRPDSPDNSAKVAGTVHPGTPRLFLDRFATPDGRARFHAVEHVGAAEQPSPDYPFYLTTGRVLAHYQSGAQTRRVRELDAGAPRPFVEVHPMAADVLGITDGELVRVTTRRGQMAVPARISAGIRRDTIFLPFHWVGANLLTNDALDPSSKMPEFKACAASLERVRQVGSAA